MVAILVCGSRLHGGLCVVVTEKQDRERATCSSTNICREFIPGLGVLRPLSISILVCSRSLSVFGQRRSNCAGGGDCKKPIASEGRQDRCVRGSRNSARCIELAALHGVS